MPNYESLTLQHNHNIRNYKEYHIAGKKDNLGIIGYISQKREYSVMVVAGSKSGPEQPEQLTVLSTLYNYYGLAVCIIDEEPCHA